MEYQSGAVSPVGSISEGWNIIKDNYWLFFGMTLVAIVILIIAALILGLVNNLITFAVATAFGIAAQGTGDVGQVSAAIVPQLISMVISIFTNIIVLTISGALFCGIYSALSRQANTNTAEFGDLFSGFQKIMPCLIVAVIMSIVQFAISLVFLIGGAALGVSAIGAGMLTRDGQLNPAIFGSLFLVILVVVVLYIVVNLIISTLTAFVYPLIAERNLSGGEAVLLSIKGGLSNIFGMILLFILLFLMSIGGALLCLVGVFFVAPIMSASIFAAFRSVFGKPQDNRQYTPPAPPVFGQQPGY
ncbi:hypothetical protein BH20ACI4_BH20ACI4_03480 [soil metagenome]